MKKSNLNANLIKKYHQDIVFNYAEYPTKDHWSFDFRALSIKRQCEWLKNNKDKRFFFMYIYLFVNNCVGFALAVSL